MVYVTVSESKHRESKWFDRVRSDSGVEPKQNSDIFIPLHKVFC